MRRILPMLLLPLVAALAVAAPASAAKPPKLSDLMRNYDLSLSLQMKSDFAFAPDPTGCNGQKAMGWAGAGQEVLEMHSTKPVRVTLYTPPDTDPSISRKDLKGEFAMTGTSRRSGQMTDVICGENHPSGIEACTGEFRFDQAVAISFYNGTWLIGGNSGPTTREAIKPCDDDRFDWDGAVARTGIVMLQSARGKAARSKMKTKGSFSLTATQKDQCDVQYFGTGSCATTWTYKATFKRVAKKAKKKHHRH
jgi:hypothetical protein